MKATNALRRLKKAYGELWNHSRAGEVCEFMSDPDPQDLDLIGALVECANGRLGPPSVAVEAAETDRFRKSTTLYFARRCTDRAVIPDGETVTF